MNACRKYTLSKIHQSIRFFTSFVFSFISVGFLLFVSCGELPTYFCWSYLSPLKWNSSYCLSADGHQQNKSFSLGNIFSQNISSVKCSVTFCITSYTTQYLKYYITVENKLGIQPVPSNAPLCSKKKFLNQLHSA